MRPRALKEGTKDMKAESHDKNGNMNAESRDKNGATTNQNAQTKNPTDTNRAQTNDTAAARRPRRGNAATSATAAPPAEKRTQITTAIKSEARHRSHQCELQRAGRHPHPGRRALLPGAGAGR